MAHVLGPSLLYGSRRFSIDSMGKPGGLRDGDEITQGKAVKFEIGVDPKSGKTKAVSVDLT
jgi:hypothetical protein